MQPVGGGPNGFRLKDESSQGAVGSGIGTFLLGFLKEELRPLLLGLIFVVLTTSFGLAIPWILKWIIDTALQDSTKLLVWGVVVYGLIEISRLATGWFQTWVIVGVGQRVMLRMRDQIQQRIQRLPHRFFESNPLGRLVNRLTNDVESLAEVFSPSIVGVLADLLFLVGAVVSMFLLDWRTGLAVVGVFPVMILITKLFAPRIRTAMRRFKESQSAMTGFLAESLSGMREIQIFRQEAQFASSFDRLNEEMFDWQFNGLKLHGVFYPLINTCCFIALALGMAAAGYWVAQGSLTVGAFIAFTVYLTGIGQPVRNIADKWTVLQNALTSGERLATIVRYTPPYWDTDALETGNSTDSQRGPTTIEFVNVGMSYTTGHPVLSGVSLVFKPDTLTAIVGATGAGKSSVVGLIQKNYPFQEGEILWNGHPIQKIPTNELRAQIGVVPQEVFLFHGTVFENIALDDPLVTIEKASRVAEEICLDLALGCTVDQVLALAVSERGSNLSVGTQQLIAIARVLVRDPSVIILDESTSSIDPKTEEFVLKAFAKLRKNRTTIMIAHRQSTLREADMIIRMANGTVIANESNGSPLSSSKVDPPL